MSTRHRHHRGLRRRAAIEWQRELRRRRIDAILRETHMPAIARYLYGESPLLVALRRSARARVGNGRPGTWRQYSGGDTGT